MTLLEAVGADGYRPEYSLLVLSDPSLSWGYEDPEVPWYRDRGDQPTGTFAGTGAGWVPAQAPDLADHVVRLELHDGRPPADHVEFDDVLEAPYRSSSGGLSLASLTGGAGPADLELGDGYHAPPLYPVGWLDEPLWPAHQSAASPVTHAYLARQTEEQRRLDHIAAELGVPSVRRKRDVFPLMVAAGILARDGTDGYRAGRPARIDTVLSLPPEQVEAIRQRDMRSRYHAVAQDLEAVLRWTPPADTDDHDG